MSAKPYWVMKFEIDKEVVTTGFGRDEAEAEADARRAVARVYSMTPADLNLLSSEPGK